MIFQIKKRFLLLPVFFSFFFFSCTTLTSLKNTTAPQIENLSISELAPPQITWTTISPGFETSSYKIDSLNVTWHCVKIDLSAQPTGTGLAINFFTLPTGTGLAVNFFTLPTGTGLVDMPTGTGLIIKYPSSTKKFARKTHSIVAVNTTPFKNKGKNNQTTGIIKAENITYSECNENYAALVLSRDSENILRCKILEKQNEDEIDEYEYAFGGFYKILQNGEILPFNKSRRSRTACGTDSTGSTLYLFAATPIFSFTDQNGLTYEECALILKQMGCTQAMQFDGGHSTSLVIDGKDTEKPFLQRKVSAGIGFGPAD